MNERCIEILFFEGCPNVNEAIDRARAASKGTGVPANVSIVRVRSQDEALRLRFLGSPTVRVDGNDVDPTAPARDDFGLQCRIYTVEGRFEGSPPVDWIAAALRDETSPVARSSSTRGGCYCNMQGKP
jgi:hypothetical protein